MSKYTNIKIVNYNRTKTCYIKNKPITYLGKQIGVLHIADEDFIYGKILSEFLMPVITTTSIEVVLKK